MFPDVSSVGVPSAKFSQDLFMQEKVRAAPGTNYGSVAEGHVRFALVASLETLEDAGNRIERFIKKNKS